MHTRIWRVIKKIISFITAPFIKKNATNMGLDKLATSIESKATKKILAPSFAVIDSILAGGRYSVGLEYENLDTGDFHTGSFDLEMPASDGRGMPFKISLPEMLPIGGVSYKESYGLHKQLSITQDGKNFSVSRNSVSDFETVYPTRPQLLHGKFDQFASVVTEPDKTFRRMIMMVRDVDMIYPTAVLERTDNFINFDNPHWNRFALPSSRDMFVKLLIGGYHFHFYAVEQRSSYVIDCLDEISKEDFVNMVYAIRTCLALLCGKFYRDAVFYFSATDGDFTAIQNFEYTTEQNSVITANAVVNYTEFFSIYGLQDEDVKAAWKPFHQMFPAAVFATLCEKCLELSGFARSIELMISAGGIADPLQKGALYSVSLETITEYLSVKGKSAPQPISDKSLAKILIKKLIDEVAKEKEKIGEEGFLILQKKLGNLNTPTNADKLTVPFDTTGIKLSDDELKILLERNKFLHGLKPKSADSKEEINLLAHEMHSLLAKLILKHAGYSGHFIHLPSMMSMQNHAFQEALQTVQTADIGELIRKVKEKDFQTKTEYEEAGKLIEQLGTFLKHGTKLQDVITII